MQIGTVYAEGSGRNSTTMREYFEAVTAYESLCETKRNLVSFAPRLRPLTFRARLFQTDRLRDDVGGASLSPATDRAGWPVGAGGAPTAAG